ncbi:hypothetical protein [Flammeovirga aprica]|uniref:Lipoprotein n=1 Tax=Flammeovirga aprica JL-4 TaxID=694437 RepID=A0A7X9S266_9BACT|nr:hypothetical protein [Flammeovirga aprica]NME73024.1 hypothetical protein [Flammeovirga aprica JL-4]
MKLLINISLSTLFIIFSISCDQQSQNQKKDIQSSNQKTQNIQKKSQIPLQQPHINAEQAKLLERIFFYDPITKYPYCFQTKKDFNYEAWIHNEISYKAVHAFIDSVMLEENRRLFKAIDSLNRVIFEIEKYGALGTIYDELYWNDEDGRYRAVGNYYSRNEYFSGWDKFNILTYVKSYDQPNNQDYSPFYMASHNKYTGDMIDRLEFDFEGTYNAIRDGRGTLVVYKDSIIHQLDGNTRKYLITDEGKFEEVK